MHFFRRYFVQPSPFTLTRDCDGASCWNQPARLVVSQTRTSHHTRTVVTHLPRNGSFSQGCPTSTTFAPFPAQRAAALPLYRFGTSAGACRTLPPTLLFFFFSFVRRRASPHSLKVWRRSITRAERQTKDGVRTMGEGRKREEAITSLSMSRLP